MSHPYWNDWYFGWGWFLWFGIIFLLFSSIGNWGYSYRAHQRFSGLPGKDAFDILNERYARGDITHEELSVMKAKFLKGNDPAMSKVVVVFGLGHPDREIGSSPLPKRRPCTAASGGAAVHRRPC